MKPRLKSTSAARDLIKAHEPFLASARQGVDGDWVVGYGHRAAAKQGISVTEADADLLLIYDVLQAEKAIDEAIGGDLGAPQRDALVSFALGIGLPAFRRSAVVRLIGKGRWRDAADAIEAWNGGGSERNAAERDLFLKDLPEDKRSTPVELVIEFDHPDEEGPVLVEAETEPPEPESSDTDDAKADGEVTETEAPVESPVTSTGPQRSALAERVILRMQAQLSGPIQESGYAATPESEEVETAEAEAEATVDDEASEPESAPTFNGPLGYAFIKSTDMEDEDELAPEPDVEPEAAVDEEPEVVDAPPVAGADASAFGEVTGQGGDATEVEIEAEEPELDMPQPEDIAAAEPVRNGQKSKGWTNGDSTPAPGKNGGHLGEIILLVIGLVLLALGIWWALNPAAEGEAGGNNFVVWAAIVVGFIFAVGAGFSLFNARRK